MSEANARIEQIVTSNDVVLFMKGTPLFPQCGFSSKAIEILDNLGVAYETVDVLQDSEVRQDRKEVRKDRQKVREDRREVRQDRRDVRKIRGQLQRGLPDEA